jgi:hypothetical protein
MSRYPIGSDSPQKVTIHGVGAVGSLRTLLMCRGQIVNDWLRKVTTQHGGAAR